MKEVKHNMDIIVKDRYSGKTTSAIQEAYWRRLPLVCMDEASKRCCTDMVKRMGYEYEVEVITVNECVRENGKYDEVVVDEAGVILERYLGAKINLATFNK